VPVSTTPDSDLSPSLSPPAKQKNKPRQPEPVTAPRIQDVIGEGLRATYESLKAEPIPDHLIRLIQQLDNPERDRDRRC
jgi:hypothetical protein